MKVIVKRTSEPGCEPPVKGAVIEEVTPYLFSFKGIKQYPAAWENFEKMCVGIVQLPDGRYRGVKREKCAEWTIEIDDIFEFVERVGMCIVIPAGDYVEKYPTVEIYDTWRE